MERALVQFFPLWAYDNLERYERFLSISANPDLNRTERCEIVNERWTRNTRADLPALQEKLTAIDPRITVLSSEGVITVMANKHLPTFVGSTHRGATNYANAYIIRVRYDDGSGGIPEADVYEETRQFLHDSIPAWCDLSIVTTGPFVFGTTDFLGFTPLEY